MAKHGLYAHLHDIQFKENQTASGTFGDDASETPKRYGRWLPDKVKRG